MIELTSSRRCLNVPQVRILIALCDRYHGTVGVEGRAKFYRELADGRRLAITSDEVAAVENDLAVRSELGL